VFFESLAPTLLIIISVMTRQTKTQASSE